MLSYCDCKTKEIIDEYLSTQPFDWVYDDIFCGSDICELLEKPSSIMSQSRFLLMALNSIRARNPTLGSEYGSSTTMIQKYGTTEACASSTHYLRTQEAKKIWTFSSSVQFTTYRHYSMKMMALGCVYGMLFNRQLFYHVSSSSLGLWMCWDSQNLMVGLYFQKCIGKFSVDLSMVCALSSSASYLSQFVEEYEALYYQQQTDRLHFCQPCLHTLLHIGPGGCTSQFMMEQTIGDLGSNIRQPSNIYGNLTQIAVWHSQLNALKNACPELDPDNVPSLLQHSQDCGDGFIFF